MKLDVSCRRATELLSQQLDRTLTLEEKVALQAHLLICRGCRAVDHQFRFMREAMRSMFGDDPPSRG